MSGDLSYRSYPRGQEDPPGPGYLFLSWKDFCCLSLLTSLYRTGSGTSIRVLHSLIYTVRVIVSGITAIDLTISRMRSALFTGSF